MHEDYKIKGQRKRTITHSRVSILELFPYRSKHHNNDKNEIQMGIRIKLNNDQIMIFHNVSPSLSRSAHLDSLRMRANSKTLDADCRKGRLKPFSVRAVVGEWAEPMMGLLMGYLTGYLLVKCTPLSLHLSSRSFLKLSFQSLSSSLIYRFVSLISA
jgi:hypothetical protein